MNYFEYNIKKNITDINRTLNEIKNRQLLFLRHQSNYTQKNKKIKFFKTCKKNKNEFFLFNKIVKVNNKTKKISNIFRFRRTKKVLKNSKLINEEKNHKKKINIIYEMVYNETKIENYIFEKVYIISLQKCNIKRDRCIKQLLKYNIENYEFFDAVNTVSNNFYNTLYEDVIKQFDEMFVKYNYHKGTLGCLLSHLKVIKDAKENNYKSILILEDDFLFKNNFEKEYLNVIDFIPQNWDFIYFGKKQGNSSEINAQLKDTYVKDYFEIRNVNEKVYIPSYTTWATHAICIKNTIFDDLIDTYTKLDSPVDLLIMKLYHKYNFYVLYDDLFVTCFDSDIRKCNELVEIKKWNWNMNNFFTINNSLKIDKIIIWGFEKISHTHHYIHNMYYSFFKEYFNNLQVLWFSNNEIESNQYIDFDNTLFFVSPTHGHYDKLPITSNSLYIFHLDNFADNLGLNIETFLNIPCFNGIINSNRGIILLAREKITDLKYFDSNFKKNIICLPWFSNKKYHDIIKIKNNVHEYYKRNKFGENLCYFGTVWYLNSSIINNLVDTCIEKNKKILFSGRFFKNTVIKNIKHPLITIDGFYNAQKNLLSIEEDNIDRLNRKFGVRTIFPIQGEEHNDNYISNRLFETICDGFVGVSNNMITDRILKSVYCNKNIGDIIDYIENLLEDEDKYCEVLNNQIDEFLTKYYGYILIQKLLGFLQKTFLKSNSFYVLNTNYDEKIYTLLFSSKADKKYYYIIDDIKSLSIVNLERNNYIIREHDYDIFLLDKILQYINYDVIIDEDYRLKNTIIDICEKNKKKYKIKPAFKIYCIFSHQRTGSTLIVDYIQKTSKKVFALSEIFNNVYINSYDVTNENGVLYGSNLIPFERDTSNIKNYINQFVDIAEEKGYESLFFKYTFDLINKFDMDNLHSIIDEIGGYNIIYLDRNDIDIFVSKKLADKNNSYSNKIYDKKIDENDFNLDKFYLFLEKKNEFLNTYLSRFNKVKYINYNFIKENHHKHNIEYINNLLNGFHSTNVEYLVYEKYYEYYNIFNKKQNKFSNISLITNAN
jgi:glycosyl transferase family 25